MEMLRELADTGRAVLAATHTTSSLSLCDRVAVMGPGGSLLFVGAPDELTGHFGVPSVAAVYEELELAAANSPPPDITVPPAPVRSRADRPVPNQSFMRQLAIIAPRSGLRRIRDTRALAVLLGQAPIIAIAIAIVLPRGAVSGDSDEFAAYYGVLISFMILTACIWLGTTASCREFVEEREIARREFAVGLRLDAYIIGTCMTLLPFVALQSILLTGIVVVLQPLPEGTIVVAFMAVMAGWAAACAGLWLSAWANTSAQATGVVPLLLIPHLLFAGALIPFDRMIAPLKLVADVTVGHWAFVGMGKAVGLDERLGSSLVQVSGLDGDAFDVQLLLPVVAMAVLGILALFGAASTLTTKLRSGSVT
jgi:hypothetical protein